MNFKQLEKTMKRLILISAVCVFISSCAGSQLDILRIRDVNSNNIVWSYDLKGTRTDKFYNIYQLTNGKDNKHIISYNFSKIIESEMPHILKSIRETLDAKK